MKIDPKFTDLPPSVEEAFNSEYLGNPNVVERVLEQFLSEMIDWFVARGEGSMTADAMKAKVAERGKAFSAIFAGENPDYKGIVGWNARGVGLAQYLKADLGHYWQSQREACNDDPYRVLYAFLLWHAFEAFKGDDPNMVAFRMGNEIQKVVRMLTGSTKRIG